ncbi:MAG TPA: universal stress protein [Nitrospiria bacterium]|jgi:nucleotide-binding universal stress UspA family protein
MSNIGNMLIPTDFSPQSQEAVDYGIQLANDLGSGIYLLHVYQEPLIVPSEPSVPMTPQVTEWLTDVQDQALKQLNVMAKEVESQVKKVKTVFKVGIPFFEIVKAAEEIPADLIVMGTHGRTGLAHFMTGSVTEMVVRKAPCPVLTVKPKGLKK